MKMRVKKTYCNSCQKLVKYREQKAAVGTEILCSNCGRHLYVFDGAAWRYIRA